MAGNRVTGLVWDPVYLGHDTGAHPENAYRLSKLEARLQAGPGSLADMQLAPREATLDELNLVHPPDHVEHIRRFSESGGGYIWLDTVAASDTFQTALLAAGGVLAAADAVVEGRVDSAFALVRPPGHHAEPAQAMGFCFFNNVAVTARYLQQRHGVGRVLIVDWDVHHGNGTEACFADDDSVLYMSLHQSPLYPGTGPAGQVGSGRGAGFTVNVPLPAGCGDSVYLAAFSRLLIPIARQFEPDMVLVSAGMDAHRLDPMSNMMVSSGGFGALTHAVRHMAAGSAQDRLALCLEGGYHPGALESSLELIMEALAAPSPAELPGGCDSLPDPAQRALTATARAQSAYWRLDWGSP